MIQDYPRYFTTLTYKRIILSEFLASLLLSLGAVSCSYSETPDICLPGVVFWVNVIGCFTGAHTNAMITTSWVFKSNKPFKFPAKIAVTYILSQVFGIFIGGLCLKFIAPQIIKHQTYWIIKDFFAQILISALYSCICHVINNKKTTFCFNQFTTWIIAAFGVLMSRQMSPHSGGCMNPSMALGLNLSKSLTTFSLSNFQSLYIFILSPIIGSLLGTLYFDYVYLPQYSTKHKIQINQ